MQKNIRTIIVVYTDRVLTFKEASAKKWYTFNTADDINVDDLISSQDYDTKMQIIKILDEAYVYYNLATGDLSNEYTSTVQREIRFMEISWPHDHNVIQAVRVID